MRINLQIILALIAALATILAALINRGETIWIYIILSFIVGVLIGAILYLQNISFKIMMPIIIIVIASIAAMIMIYYTPSISNQSPVLIDLTSDKASPQISGASINWTVNAIDENNDQLYYKFSLKGPSTGDKWQELTEWTSSKSWEWKTSNLDSGSNRIRAMVSDRKDIDKGNDSKDVDYTLASARITFPGDNDKVTGFQPMKGTSKGISPGTWKTKSPNWRTTSDGYQLWIFVYPPGDGYHPQDLDINVDVDGDWFTQAGIGEEQGINHKFNLLAVLADANATKIINKYYEDHNGSNHWPGLPALPKGAVQVDEKSVTRI